MELYGYVLFPGATGYSGDSNKTIDGYNYSYVNNNTFFPKLTIESTTLVNGTINIIEILNNFIDGYGVYSIYRNVNFMDIDVTFYYKTSSASDATKVELGTNTWKYRWYNANGATDYPSSP